MNDLPGRNIRSLELKIILAYGISISLLMLLGLLEHRTVQNLATSDQWVEHSEDVLSALNKLLTAFAREASAHSAYLVESSKPNLDSWRLAQGQTDLSLLRVRKLTVDDPAQQQRILQIHRLIQDHRNNSLRESIEQPGTSRLVSDWSARLAFERSTQEDIENLILHMFQVERQLLAERHTAAGTSARRTVLITSAGSVMVVVLLFFAIILIHRDFAGRLQAESAWLHERELLHLLMDNVPDLIYFKDGEGRFTRVNRAEAAKLGVESPEEAIGKTQSDFLEIDVARAIEAEEMQVMKSGQAFFAHPEQIRFADGQARWLSVSRVPVKSDAGTVTRLLAVSRDITRLKEVEEALEESNDVLEQRVADRTAMLSQSNEMLKAQIEERQKAESALRESEEKYRLLFESNPNPMWVYDLESLQFLAVNKAAVQNYGYTEDQFLGMTILEIRPEEDREAVQQNVAKIGSEESSVSEWKHTKKNGSTIDVEVVTRPVTFNGRKARLVLAHDVTAKKQAEAVIRTLNQTLEERVLERTAELEAANKELEAFSYSVSHDLRAPLRQVAGFSKLLLEDCSGNLDEKAQHYFRRVIEATDRMSTLVDHLLKLSKVTRQELAKKPTDLNAVMRAALDDVRDGDSDREVQWETGNLPVVACDPDLVRQVFTNLLANALKFTRGREPAVIRVDQIIEGGKTVIFVKDNGVGFDMKHAARLFAVFQRLHAADEFEGTGVGLATVDRIVRKHGGEIWAESQPDKGATFYFTLGAAAATKREND